MYIHPPHTYNINPPIYAQKYLNFGLWPKRPPLAFFMAETSVAEMSWPKRPWPKCPWPKYPTFLQCGCVIISNPLYHFVFSFKMYVIFFLSTNFKIHCLIVSISNVFVSQINVLIKDFSVINSLLWVPSFTKKTRNTGKTPKYRKDQ